MSSLNDVSLKDVSLKDVSLKDVMVPTIPRYKDHIVVPKNFSCKLMGSNSSIKMNSFGNNILHD